MFDNMILLGTPKGLKFLLELTCVCQDGEKYSGKEIIKKCIIMKNPIETCNCEDGTTWTPKN